MDRAVSLFVLNNLHSKFLTPIMLFVSKITHAGLFWIALNLIFLILAVIKYKKLSLAVAVSLVTLLVGWLINDKVLKNVFERPRPFVVIEEIRLFMESIGYTSSGYSFPSGHSFSSMEQAIILTGMNKKLGYFTIPFAVIVGFSRIYLGAHYLTDVIAGLILGLLFGLLANFVIKKLKNNEKLKSVKWLL